MVRISAAVVIPIAVAALVVCIPPAAASVNPSVCVVAAEGCLTSGDIHLQIIVGPSDTAVLGGQFTVRYDPNVFTLKEAAPGRACDPTSPFALELLVDDDHGLGEVRCAIGVDFTDGLPPAGGSSTLACLTFAPIAEAADPTPVCLLQGQNPFETVLVDQAGYLLPIDNSQDCPPDSPPPVLACAETAPDPDCVCVPDTADCHALDTPCRTGVCDPLTSHCEVVFVNEGGLCDDDDPLTPLDRCMAGTCIGEGLPQPQPLPKLLHLLRVRPTVSR